MNESEVMIENVDTTITQEDGNKEVIKSSRSRKKKSNTETETSSSNIKVLTETAKEIAAEEATEKTSDTSEPVATDNVAPAIAVPKAKAFRPGYLRSEAAILLQTINAQHYFFSRSEGAVSLNYFNKMMVAIWQAAAADDPYADLFLLKVYDAMLSTRRELQQLNQKYATLIQQDGVELPIISTDVPLRLSLNYFIPYSFMAVYLLTDYDQLARCILSVKRFGFLPNDIASSVLREAGDKFSRVLSIPLQWQATGVTREDMHKDNELAKKAIELMGPLNPQVLAGTLRAPYAPIIKKPASETSASATT